MDYSWLNAIQKRESEATPGPWHFMGEVDAVTGIESLESKDAVLWAYGEHTPGWVEVGDADAEFICAARQDIPHLLELLAKAKAELAHAEATSVIQSEEELMALPVGSYVRAEWGTDGGFVGVVRAEHGGASSSQFTIASDKHWRGLWDWTERITVLYRPSDPSHFKTGA